MLHRCHERGIIDSVRQLNGDDRMIKTIVRWSIRGYRSTFGVDYDVVRFHADCAQHGAHQGRLVLAVAVAMVEDVGRRVGLPAADAKLNGDVTNVFLHELGNGLHLIELSRGLSGKVSDLLLDLGGGLATSAG